MGKIQGPTDQVFYYRLDKFDAAKLRTMAVQQERPASDLSRKAVRQFIEGGAEKWAAVETAKIESNADPMTARIQDALGEDGELAVAVLLLAGWARENAPFRSVLLSLARLQSPQGKAPKRRTKRSEGGELETG